MYSISLQYNFSLKKFNSFGIDAKAYIYIAINDINTLFLISKNKKLLMLPRLILGGGSNILFTQDFPGLVLHMCNIGMHIINEDNSAIYVKAAAGQNWHDFVKWTLDQGLGGLENLSLIPGTVGGALIQNIGAYGIEVKERLHTLTIFDLIEKKILILNNANCCFSYRNSIFKKVSEYRVILIDVTFSMPKQWKAIINYVDVQLALNARGIIMPSPVDIFNVIVNIRKYKLPDPTHIGNAGSFFKNPIVSAQYHCALLKKYPQLVSYIQVDGNYRLAAGWLIEKCGWKGKKIGAVGVYKRQALVLINLGGANGKDIATVAYTIQLDILINFGIVLEIEPVLI